MAGLVFISYSHHDRAFVTRLTTHLRQAGIEVWTDEGIEHGDDWPQSIEANIRACAAFVPVMSSRSREAAWVRREILMAQSLNKPILPLLLSGPAFIELLDIQHEDIAHGALPSAAFTIRLQEITTGPGTGKTTNSPGPVSPPMTWFVDVLIGTDPVTSLAWSPDGSYLATAGWEETARIWNPSTGATVHTLAGHEDSVNLLTWSPDGRFLATASADNTARIWNPATGATVHTLAGHEHGYSLAWSPDGRHVAAAGGGHPARVLDAATGTVKRTLNGHIGSSEAVAWSPDGHHVAVDGAQGDVLIWHPASSSTVRTLTGHPYRVNRLEWSPDERHLAVGTGASGIQWFRNRRDLFRDLNPRIWDAIAGTTMHALASYTNGVNSLVWSPDGWSLATASHGEPARIWNTTTGTLVHTLEGHTDTIYDAAWSPDGRHLATAGHNEPARIWNTKTGTLVRILQGHTDTIYAVAWSPDGRHLATAGGDHTARIWLIDE